jgi:hypothetical protein
MIRDVRFFLRNVARNKTKKIEKTMTCGTKKKKKDSAREINHSTAAAAVSDAPPPLAVNFSNHRARPASLSTSLPAARSLSGAGCTRHSTSSVRDT